MKNRIRILATSDFHGMIYPYIYSDNSEAMLGMARMKTLISALRDENTILVDNGDVLQGSSIQTYHYLTHPSEVSPATIAFNEIGFDYINIGNHDFDYGGEALAAHLNYLSAPCLTSNVTYKGKPLGASYAVREIAGKKIALFGVTTHFLKNWQGSKQLRSIKLRDACQCAKRTVEMITRLEKPDYIIGLYHGSFERDLVTGQPDGELNGENQAYEMLKDISGIDVLITGHAHMKMNGTLFGKHYVQTGQYGDCLACIDIYTDTGVIETKLLNNDAPADEAMMKLVQPEEDECQKLLDTVIGHTSMDLLIQDDFAARIRKTQVITFINNLMREVTGADLAGSSLFKNATGFHKDITMRDLVSTYRFADSLVVKKITGAQLRQYLEQSVEFWSIEGERIIINPRFIKPKYTPYYYDMADGVEYTVRVSNDIGHRIESLTRNGVPVKDDDEMTICLCQYRANGGGNYDMFKNLKTVSTYDKDMIQIMYDHIRNNPNIDFEPVNNITIVK